MFDIPGWFFEATPFGEKFSLGVQIREKLFERRSAFQKIEIYQTEGFGRMLVLDGIIQLTEFDEFGYHELFVHVPMTAHPDPRAVLVIGGGDGGILRELIAYPEIERIDHCEIDGEVIEAAKKFLPFTACGYDDPRVEVHVEDGAGFLEGKNEEYDLILIDSSDPIGPAEALFKKPFYELVARALKADGAAVSQCESIYLFLPLINKMVRIAQELFPEVQYMNGLVPTYPSGMIGQLICSKGPDFSAPIREIPESIQDRVRYYTPEIHHAAFHLPSFAAKDLRLAKQSASAG